MEINPQEELKKTALKSNTRKTYVWLGGYITVAVIALAGYILFRLHAFDLLGKYRIILQKLSLATFIAVLVLAASKFIEILIRKRYEGRFNRYNLVHLTRLVTIIIVALIIISFLFTNWYAAAVSLGLFSLILGFALQTPISSFIGWIYIIIRTPYKIGDRIQIDPFKGDVIEIGYFDTTLWEFGGDYLTNDLPSGRLIRFPNQLVLQSSVYNYSWEDFKYIWNEIPFHVAYESDLDFVEEVVKRIATNHLGPSMADRVVDLKKLIRESPVSGMDIKEYPFVSFRINANTWVEVAVTYLVPPKKAATVRTAIIRNILAEFNKAPEKVLFPNGNSR